MTDGTDNSVIRLWKRRCDGSNGPDESIDAHARFLPGTGNRYNTASVKPAPTHGDYRTQVTSFVKSLGFAWGVGGVLALLLFAVYRLGRYAVELGELSLSTLEWVALIISILYMSYAEGYKGFHRSFAPRVVVRADYLLRNPRPVLLLLAPLFCMGYIHATRKRMLLSLGLTAMIICFVILVRILPQPWRGIVDAGVVAGLGIGVLSIFYFLLQWKMEPGGLAYPVEVPRELQREVPGDT
ncbi:MAG: hypothetical protein WDZ76_13600 [Pseudohongiellaceae bacterium]